MSAASPALPLPVVGRTPLARLTGLAVVASDRIGQLASSRDLTEAEFALANQASAALSQLKRLLLDRLEAQDGDTAQATAGQS